MSDPDWSVHPGELLAEMLAERRLSQVWLARHIGVSPKHVNLVIHGHVRLTPRMAVAVALALGKQRGVARTLARMQTDHDVFIEWQRMTWND